MRQKEQRLWDCLKAHAPAELGLQRVENLVGDGMPDVYSDGTGAWIELKAPTRPKRESTPLLGESEGLRTSQKNWIRIATARGRKVFVLIRDSEGELFLMPGKFATTMNGMTRAELRERSLAEDWQGIIWEIKNAER